VADFDEELYSYLTDQKSVTDLVSTRIFPDYVPQDESLPAIAYILEDDAAVMAQQGPCGLRSAIYVLDVWGTTREQVTDIATAIRTLLDGQSADFGSISMQAGFLENMSRTQDPDSDEYNVTMRWRFWYSES